MLMEVIWLAHRLLLARPKAELIIELSAENSPISAHTYVLPPSADHAKKKPKRWNSDTRVSCK